MNKFDELLWKEFNKDIPYKNILKEYIAEGADINSKNENGGTILTHFLDVMLEKINYYKEDANGDLIHFSNELPNDNDEHKLRLILELGADPNINVEDSGSCLYEASIICWPNFVKILLDYNAKPDDNSEFNFISLLEAWIEDDKVFRCVNDGIDRNKNMKIIINMLKEHDIK